MRVPLPWLPVVALAVAACGCAPEASDRARASARSTPPVVTLAEYGRLRPRMTYLTVRMIVGAPGKELASNYEPTIRGELPSAWRRMYVWENRDGSSMTVLFEEDGLVFATQSGLK
jgi:hypothetical protein